MRMNDQNITCSFLNCQKVLTDREYMFWRNRKDGAPPYCYTHGTQIQESELKMVQEKFKKHLYK